MKTVDRYLLKEIFPPFIRTILFLSVLMVFGQLLKLADQFSSLGLSATSIMKAICYSFAPSMGIILPLSLLIATILAFGRLAADGELTAFAASGMPFGRLLVTPLCVGVIVSGLAMFFSVYGEPWGIKSLQNMLSDAVKESLSREIQPNNFYSWFSEVMVYVQDVDKNHKLKKLLFVDGRNDNSMMAVTAKSGQLIPYGDAAAMLFSLENGDVILFQNDELTKIHFGANEYRLDLSKLSDQGGEGLFVARQGLSLHELQQEAANQNYRPKVRRRFIITFHKKLALPLAAIIFSLLGALLASGRSRHSLAKGLLTGVVVIGIYYFVMRTGEQMAADDVIAPWLAIWSPNCIFLAITGVYAVIKTRLVKG